VAAKQNPQPDETPEPVRFEWWTLMMPGSYQRVGRVVVGETVITSKIAAEILEHRHPLNRRVRQGAVDRIARDMAKERFVFTGQPIIFNSLGNLIDGQHRLRAIRDSGRPQTLLVVLNVPAEAFEALDQGDVRPVATVMGELLNYPDAKIASGAVRIVRQFLKNGIPQHSTGRLSLSRAEVIDGYKELTGMADAVRFVVRKTRSVSALFASQVGPAALHWIFSRVSPQRSEAFFTALDKGSIPPGDAGTGLTLLHARLVKESRESGRLPMPVLSALTIKAWNVFNEPRDMGNLSYQPPRESFPRVFGWLYHGDGKTPVFGIDLDQE
jgi:hypothetical protein